MAPGIVQGDLAAAFWYDTGEDSWSERTSRLIEGLTSEDDGARTRDLRRDRPETESFATPLNHRRSEARQRCVAAHGTNCSICGFSFGAIYGAEANGYIHVHHIRPLSEVEGEYVVDPIEDLRPVCPNCHAVLHLGGRCRNIEEVRQLLERQTLA